MTLSNQSWSQRVAVHITPQGRALGAVVVLMGAGGATFGIPVLCASSIIILLMLLVTYRWIHQHARQMAHLRVLKVTWKGVRSDQIHEFSVSLDSSHVHRPLDLSVSLYSDGFESTPTVRVTAPPMTTGEIPIRVRLPEVGRWRLHAVEVNWNGFAQLYAIGRRQPLSVDATVWPMDRFRLGDSASQSFSGTNWTDAPRSAVRRGQQGDVRELTEYVPGDSAHAIAWKATARHNRLLVRRHDETYRSTVMILVNVGPVMRSGVVGDRPLDRAISMANALIDRHRGDRTGVVIFDHRVITTVDAGAGAMQSSVLVEALLNVAHLSDRDLTEVSDAEVLAHVGRFLRNRLPWSSAPDAYLHQDEDFSAVLAGLYDKGGLAQAMITYDHLFNGIVNAPGSRPTCINEMTRQFCFRQRIRLPYRLSGPDLLSRRGFEDAFRRSLLTRPDQIYVVDSPLATEGSDGWARACSQARGQGVVLTPLYCDAPKTDEVPLSPRPHI